MRVVGLEPKISCVRDRHDTTKPQVAEQILILNPIHASVILRFSEFTEFNKSSAPFRENPIVLERVKFCLVLLRNGLSSAGLEQTTDYK